MAACFHSLGRCTELPLLLHYLGLLALIVVAALRASFVCVRFASECRCRSVSVCPHAHTFSMRVHLPPCGSIPRFPFRQQSISETSMSYYNSTRPRLLRYRQYIRLHLTTHHTRSSEGHVGQNYAVGNRSSTRAFPTNTTGMETASATPLVTCRVYLKAWHPSGTCMPHVAVETEQ